MMNRQQTLLAVLLSASSACTDAPTTKLVTSALEDKSASPSMSLIDHQGHDRVVILESAEVTRTNVADAEREVKTAENQIAVYRNLYRVLQRTRFERELKLPHPDTLTAKDTALVTGLLGRIGSRVDEIRQELFADTIVTKATPMPEVQIAEGKPCSGGFPADVGSDELGDRQSVKITAVCGLSPSGILFNDPRDYRSHLSCVKDQANRGTCGAFALASVMEMQHSMTFGTRVDLSEQAIYARAEGPSYGMDGMAVGQSIAAIVSDDKANKVPYESVWNYNPSHERTDAGLGWQNSCKGYDELCTEHAGQIEMEIFEQTENSIFFSPIYPTFDQGLGLAKKAVQLWDGSTLASREASVQLMKAALLTDQQLIASVMVTQSFYAGVVGDGFISYAGGAEGSSGAHAVHIVNFMDNGELARIAPAAPPGGGGGYFIVRNSWGPCTGDGGYLYVPYNRMVAPGFVNSILQLSPNGVLPLH